MKIVIRPETEAEITEAYHYYEAVSEGLGGAFLLAVEACLDGIERSPTMYAAIYKDVRRGLLRRFPYGIFYIVEQEAIVVLACFHARRDPKQWQRRV
jgi:plasmid stabilization system protein ParE